MGTPSPRLGAMSASGDLVEAWRQHLALDRRRSTHTVRAYMATAERLIAFLTEHRGEAVTAAGLARVDQADLRAFLTARRMDGIGNGSAARELSAVRGFLKFTGGEDARVPLLKGPKVKRGLPRPISPDEAVALAGEIAETAREGWIGARDWAVLLLLYGAGLRIGEAMGLMGDVLPLSDTLRVTGKRARADKCRCCRRCGRRSRLMWRFVLIRWRVRRRCSGVRAVVRCRRL